MIDDIIAFENGELDDEGVLALFAGLIKSGVVWRLQGSYGRTAYSLIQQGLIDPAGNITGATCNGCSD